VALQQPGQLSVLAVKPCPIRFPIRDGKSLVAATAPHIGKHFQMLFD
jgi:hypothetical protein